MIGRPPRSTQSRSSAASDVYKRQPYDFDYSGIVDTDYAVPGEGVDIKSVRERAYLGPVSYTHLRAHETVLDLVCRLLLEKKNN